jgi:hypothetical protein
VARDQDGLRRASRLRPDDSRGVDDRTVNQQDANGVALAAIQALHDRIASLERSLSRMEEGPEATQAQGAEDGAPARGKGGGSG